MSTFDDFMIAKAVKDDAEVVRLRTNNRELLQALEEVYNYLIGLHAYLLSCEKSVILDNLESMSAFAYKQAEFAEAAIRKVKVGAAPHTELQK